MSKKRVHHRWVRESCSECKGTGIAQYAMLTEWGLEPTRYVDCEKCKGTGSVNVALPKERK